MIRNGENKKPLQGTVCILRHGINIKIVRNCLPQFSAGLQPGRDLVTVKAIALPVTPLPVWMTSTWETIERKGATQECFASIWRGTFVIIGG